MIVAGGRLGQEERSRRGEIHLWVPCPTCRRWCAGVQTVVSKLNLDDKSSTTGSPSKRRTDGVASDSKDSFLSPSKRAQTHRAEPWLGTHTAAHATAVVWQSSLVPPPPCSCNLGR